MILETLGKQFTWSNWGFTFNTNRRGTVGNTATYLRILRTLISGIGVNRVMEAVDEEETNGEIEEGEDFVDEYRRREAFPHVLKTEVEMEGEEGPKLHRLHFHGVIRVAHTGMIRFRSYQRLMNEYNSDLRREGLQPIAYFHFNVTHTTAEQYAEKERLMTELEEEWHRRNRSDATLDMQGRTGEIAVRRPVEPPANARIRGEENVLDVDLTPLFGAGA